MKDNATNVWKGSYLAASDNSIPELLILAGRAPPLLGTRTVVGSVPRWVITPHRSSRSSNLPEVKPQLGGNKNRNARRAFHCSYKYTTKLHGLQKTIETRESGCC